MISELFSSLPCFILQPKCGFIPFSSEVTHEMKHKVCRYCMHQHLKVRRAHQPVSLCTEPRTERLGLRCDHLEFSEEQNKMEDLFPFNFPNGSHSSLFLAMSAACGSSQAKG